MYFKKVLLVLLALAQASVALGDVIYLINGDRISGIITGISGGEVNIASMYAGELGIALDQVVKMSSEGKVALELPDGTVGKFQLKPGTTAGDVLLLVAGTIVEVPLGEVKTPVVVEKYVWDAKADLSSVISRGNTDSQNTNLQANYKLKTGDHRYKIVLAMAREELDSITTKKKDRLNLGYDYLFFENWFFALDTTYERDPIALLDRRVSLNPALGYEVWGGPDRTLNFQFGAGYASEKTDGEDESGSNVDWRLEFEQDLQGGRMTVFHNHNVYQNLDGRKNTVVLSRTGVRYEITTDLYLNLQANYDFDTDPAEGSESRDLTFLVGAGYKF
ncbi:MAG: putative salt-induced outer membrane protein YdiY [Candidatus Azotimanducaceae bacterium]|jgi:putative salt-induced outer membrane protein YdiY